MKKTNSQNAEQLTRKAGRLQAATVCSSVSIGEIRGFIGRFQDQSFASIRG
jgi:hypothetical protein